MHDRLLLRRSLGLFRDVPKAFSLGHLDTSDVSTPKPRSAFTNDVYCAHVTRRESLVKRPEERERRRKNHLNDDHREEVDGDGLSQVSSHNS